MLRKYSPNGLFDIPKSSFGEHKVVTKDHIASQKNQHIASLACCYHLLYRLAKLLQKIIASQKNQRIACCYYLLSSSCKVVTKDHSIPENQHIASLACCYHLLYSYFHTLVMMEGSLEAELQAASTRRFSSSIDELFLIG